MPDPVLQTAPSPQPLRVPSLPTAARPPCRRPIAAFLSFPALRAAQDARFCRTRLSGCRRLHGPGKLGHRPRRRIEIRLHAAERRPVQQPDGDFLQALSAKLGIATGRDLAQACREHYSPRVRIVLWLLCEIAIAACDLAEVLGSAVALKLLFGLPLAGRRAAHRRWTS